MESTKTQKQNARCGSSYHTSTSVAHKTTINKPSVTVVDFTSTAVVVVVSYPSFTKITQRTRRGHMRHNMLRVRRYLVLYYGTRQ